MDSVLNRNLFFVREHVGVFKAANNYDILDPETGQVILECREDNLGFFTRIFRITDLKLLTPFDIRIRTPDGQQVVRVERGAAFFLSTVNVMDGADESIGSFRQKLFTIGGGFTVLDTGGRPMFDVKGKWTGWNFRLERDGVEFARITKKWSGLGKELFTSADNYMIKISDVVPKDNPVRLLILAAAMCIDMVLQEHRGHLWRR